MATEELILAAVRAGGDRQDVHEVIRRHSVAAAKALSEGADRNDLFDRLARDPEFRIPLDEIRTAAAPERFIGRSAQQVDEFLSEVVEPLLASAGAAADAPGDLRV
jgi:adenylosuccinate lyase